MLRHPPGQGGFVVLPVTAHLGAGHDGGPARLSREHAGIGQAGVNVRVVQTRGGAGGNAEPLCRRPAQLHPVAAGHHGVLGGQQGVGARRQPGHAGVNGDLSAHLAGGGQPRVQRCRRSVHRGQNGIDFPIGAAGMPRGGVGQGRIEDVHGAAGPVAEPQPPQGAAGGGVDHGALFGHEGGGAEADATASALSLLTAGQPGHIEIDFLTVVEIVDAVRGVAVRQGQARGAD